jgi:hypothetical protein
VFARALQEHSFTLPSRTDRVAPPFATCDLGDPTAGRSGAAPDRRGCAAAAPPLLLGVGRKSSFGRKLVCVDEQVHRVCATQDRALACAAQWLVVSLCNDSAVVGEEAGAGVEGTATAPVDAWTSCVNHCVSKTQDLDFVLFCSVSWRVYSYVCGGPAPCPLGSDSFRAHVHVIAGSHMDTLHAQVDWSTAKVSAQ